MPYQNPLHVPVSYANLSSYNAIGSAIPAVRRRVPQATDGISKSSINTIAFDFVGYPQQGMPLRELYVRGAHALQQMMEGPDDPVLAHTRLRMIKFRISWPGYEHVEWNRAIEIITSTGPITRAYLGTVIAHHFALFIEKAQSENSRHGDWRLGSDGLRLDHIVLLSIHSVSEDTWQAEVAVDFR
ncbi:hypothetical protein V5O48_011268 [Marasmius crinis-equi]|uniref:Uncharacterized protein n=1 Tax=Marasmius crinis-equi TaxID=585013 RepID=A0ABR3F627_9AGAR